MKRKPIIRQINVNIQVRNPEDIQKVVSAVSQYVSKHKHGDMVTVNINGKEAPAGKPTEDDLSVL